MKQLEIYESTANQRKKHNLEK